MNAPIDVSSVRLETPRLFLRPFALEDLDDFYAYAKVPDVGEWAGWCHHQNIGESRRVLSLFIAEKKTFALEEKATHRVIGSLGLEEYHCVLPPFYDSRRGRELGYVLAKDKWGQGYMSEAVARVIAFCFEEMNLDFLTCAHFVRNERSKRVIEKAGFRLMGHDVYATLYGTKEDDCYYVLDNPKRRGE
jgi:[ribosomal protein S5]-alanine N-acetyltransferase